MTAQGPPSVRSEHDVRVAMCFHGLLAAWKGRHAPPAVDQAVNATRSLAKFAAASIHKHVLSPARAAGVAVAVFIHSTAEYIFTFSFVLTPARAALGDLGAITYVSNSIENSQDFKGMDMCNRDHNLSQAKQTVPRSAEICRGNQNHKKTKKGVFPVLFCVLWIVFMWNS